MLKFSFTRSFDFVFVPSVYILKSILQSHVPQVIETDNLFPVVEFLRVDHLYNYNLGVKKMRIVLKITLKAICHFK